MSEHVNASATFVTTQWTRVLEARGNSIDSGAALSDLCAAYYAPVFAFIRRSATDEESARDLTHEFFLRLLEPRSIGNVDPRHGRFRSYLLGAVKHFLADVRERASRLKRGGGQVHEPILPESDTTSTLDLRDPNAQSPEREFDRKWAINLLDRALKSLSKAHNQAGTLDQFTALKVWLTGDTENISQAETARLLGMQEGAVKVAIHRLRRQFRQAIKDEIAQTLHNRSQVDEEMKFLLDALL